MSTTLPEKKPTAQPPSVIDSVMEGAEGLMNSAAEKLQAVKEIFKSVAETNTTFRKSIESNESVTKEFFSTLKDALKSAETPEERERLLRMGQETAAKATDASVQMGNTASDFGKGALLVLGAIALGTVAILKIKNGDD